MRIVLKDKKGALHVLNSAAHREQPRGGRGRKPFDTKHTPLSLAPYMHLQLLPGQSILLTCPGCQEKREFKKPGYRRVNLHCEKCAPP